MLCATQKYWYFWPALGKYSRKQKKNYKYESKELV